MATKIQINSLEALERLLGQDLELEIEVRKSVVEAFAKGFCKSVANVDGIAKAINELKDSTTSAARDIAYQELGISKENHHPWKKSTVTLTAEAKKEIQTAVRTEYELLLWQQIREYKALVADDVKERADKMLEEYVGTAVHDYMAKRDETVLKLQALVDSIT